MLYWNVAAEEVERALETSVSRGLAPEEAGARLAEKGPNEFERPKPESVAHMVARQFKDIANVILLIAAGLSLALAFREGEGFLEPAVILAVIVVNCALAVTQERGAERALEALGSLNAPTCTVVRGGETVELATAELVPGDVVLLKTGDLVPADLRLVESAAFAVDESSLTGESEPAEKDAAAAVEADAALGDRANMAFSGCLVTAGSARAVVVATGMATEMGKIAGYLGTTQKLQTPLQRRLNRVSRSVSAVAAVAALALLATGLQQGEEFWSMVLAAVSLAVATVPETLQLIVTLTLTQGVRNMAEKNALVRSLPAVETLGSTSVICSDKTGTLTQNRMSVVRTWMPPYADDNLPGQLSSETGLVADDNCPGRLSSGTGLVAFMALACAEPPANATEAAILRRAGELGIDRQALLAAMPRAGEVPFSSERKMATSVHALPEGGYLVLTKGALDRLPLAPATPEAHAAHAAAHDAFAADALRVLALGARRVDALPASGDLAELERDLELQGLIGLIDPPRPEAAAAIEVAKRAGIRTVMITGDHAATAAAIARDLGILDARGRVVTGRELSNMTDDELVANVRSYSVYARVSPEDKIRIVEAWQEQGEVVAMTGDGVNDAPALRAADVGVAMGRSGTEVAKAAADMVLTTDDFATIVDAVREGRGVFSNIKRTVYFLLACNLSEIVVMLGAQLLGWGTPLTPVMLLLINMLGDGIPGLRLAHDSSDERIMARKPIGRNESFFAGGLMAAIAQQTAVFSVVSLVAFWLGAIAGVPGVAGLAGAAPSVAAGQTMCFLVVAFTSILHVFTVRTRNSVVHRTVLDNKPLLASVVGVSAVFVVLVAAEPLGAVFGLVPIAPVAWAAVALLSLVPTVVAEAVKLWQNHRHDIAYRLRLVRHREDE